MNNRILLADDDVDATAALALFFEFHHFDVRIAHDGVAALGLFAVWEPNAAVIDINMPGANGYHVAREIRIRQKSGRRTLLIALTGELPSEEVAEKCRAAGFDQHIDKPADLPALLEFVGAAGQFDVR